MVGVCTEHVHFILLGHVPLIGLSMLHVKVLCCLKQNKVIT